MILAWHFARHDMRLGYGDGRKIVVGETLSVDRTRLEPCRYGLHGSISIMDALQYAPGPMICRVELGGKIIAQSDKVCAETRRVIAVVDGTDLLRKHARDSALSVAHLWEMPYVVRQYLETGDKSLRHVACDVALDVVWAADSGAARAAARAVTGAAARAAARAAAWDAAWDAYCAVAMAVTGAVAGEAALAAAWAATSIRLERAVLAAMGIEETTT